jgi:hypothetical protein
MVFVTLSETDLPPYDTTAVLVISTVAWLVAWAVGPGRGHPFFLGAGLLGAWWSALELIEGLFSAPFTIVGAFFDAFSEPFAPGADPFDPGFDGTFGPGSFVEPSVPDATTVGLISLLFGIAYLVVGRRLDRAGRFGVGTPFAVATLPCLLLAVTSLADDLDVGGTGALLISLGALLAWHGATVGRRLTTWVGGAGVAIGVATLLSDVSDSALVIGMLYLAAGIGTVAVAHAVGQALSEPAETVPGPSVLRSGSGTTAPPPPGAPPGPPAGQAAGAWGTNAPPPPPPPHGSSHGSARRAAVGTPARRVLARRARRSPAHRGGPPASQVRVQSCGSPVQPGRPWEPQARPVQTAATQSAHISSGRGPA